MKPRRKHRRDGLCPRCCHNPKRAGNGYCRPCHAAYMREHRPKHRDLPEEARRRANCRSYANVYLRRGKIQRQPCESCGSPDAQMHHEDYSKPLAIRWLCRGCHLGWHQAEGPILAATPPRKPRRVARPSPRPEPVAPHRNPYDPDWFTKYLLGT